MPEVGACTWDEAAQKSDRWDHSIEVCVLEDGRLRLLSVTIRGSRDRRHALERAAMYVIRNSRDLDAQIRYTHHKWARRSKVD